MNLVYVAAFVCCIALPANCSLNDIGVELPVYPKYRVVKTQRLSWNSARSQCQKHGGDLVCFEDDQEWSDVGQALMTHFPRSNFFIGGRGDGKGNVC